MSDDQPGAAADAGGREWNVPWAEPWAAREPERAELAASFGGAIRKTGSLMQLMNQAAADRIGINATDLNCLNILSFSGQMTAGELARADRPDHRVDYRGGGPAGGSRFCPA